MIIFTLKQRLLLQNRTVTRFSKKIDHPRQILYPLKQNPANCCSRPRESRWTSLHPPVRISPSTFILCFVIDYLWLEDLISQNGKEQDYQRLVTERVSKEVCVNSEDTSHRNTSWIVTFISFIYAEYIFNQCIFIRNKFNIYSVPYSILSLLSLIRLTIWRVMKATRFHRQAPLAKRRSHGNLKNLIKYIHWFKIPYNPKRTIFFKWFWKSSRNRLFETIAIVPTK